MKDIYVPVDRAGFSLIPIGFGLLHLAVRRVGNLKDSTAGG